MPAGLVLYGFNERGDPVYVRPCRATYPTLRRRALSARAIARRAVARNLSDEACERAITAASKALHGAIAARRAGN